MKLYETGIEIKKLRKEYGLTQQQLAEKSGISRITLGRLERGEIASISLKTFDRILHALNHEIAFTPQKEIDLPTLDDIGQKF